MADELAAVADELYALPPEGFVAERDARAKQLRTDGDRDLAADVKALPRPTAAAWLLNQLARLQPDAVQELVSLGAELRDAQENLDGDQLRALDRQRRQVVRAFARQAAELADDLGRPLSGSVADQVNETLRAAVADEEAGEALLTGTLTTALSYVGMGEGSVSRAVAVPGARPSGTQTGKQPAGKQSAAKKSAAKKSGAKKSGAKKTAEPERPDEVAAARQRRLEETRSEVAEAEQAAEDAVDALAERERELAAADERYGGLAERLAELRAELERAEAEAAEAETARDEARRQRDDAASEADEVRETLEAARERLDQLEE